MRNMTVEEEAGELVQNLVEEETGELLQLVLQPLGEEEFQRISF